MPSFRVRPVTAVAHEVEVGLAGAGTALAHLALRDREGGAKVTHAVQLEVYARAVHATGEDVERVILYV